MEGNVLCCGCLCSERKMNCIEDFWRKQCFIQIINEIPMPHSLNRPVWLCWECEAYLNRFISFKQRVKNTYKVLYACTKESTNEYKPQTNLGMYIINDISVHCIRNSDTDIAVKEEIPTVEDNIKDEIDSDNLDDDSLLIEYKKKKKKVKKKKRKEEVQLYKEVELTAEVEEERRMLALKEEYLNAMFRCDKCIMPFPNADDLKDHIQIKHKLNASNYKCDICECTFATEVSFNYHWGRHARRYTCTACTNMFASKRAATRHYEMTHCNGINLEYDKSGHHQNGQLEQTDSTKLETSLFPCDYCEKTFRWKTSLRKHLERHKIETGQKRKPYCESCRISFMTTSNLQKHVKTSSKHQIQLKLRKLKDSLTDDSMSPENHQARIEQIKKSVNKSREQYPCPQCDKRFLWRGNLLRHLHSHTARANGELVCEPCNRTFSSIATYKQHMEISKKHVTENEFKYMCSDCGQKFANKTRLRDHINWEHLKNFVHTCTICQKVFKSHTSLYLHKQVVHQKGHAEHLCDHCGKPFPNQAKLRSHMTALHSGAAPYRCVSCPARFSWHSCLSRHQRRVHRLPRSTLRGSKNNVSAGFPP
ncbi:LOW QUALITY PROTEIN: zinc finger protein 711 [Aphomia sociella]